MSSAPESSLPERTCVGCRETGSPGELVRLTLGEDGVPVFDGQTRAPGRGAWLHPKKDCVKNSAPRGLSRAFRRTVSLGPRELCLAARRRAEEWLVELLGEARRKQNLSTGVSACRKAWTEGRLGLLILAGDTSTLPEQPWLAEVIGAGKALGFATRAELAAGFGQDAGDMLAVLDEGLSDALSGLLTIGRLDWERPNGARLGYSGQCGPNGRATTSVILEAG